MMNIGIIGIGFMGTTHFNAAKALHGARVSAISSRDRAKLSGDWSQISGNLGRQGGVQDLTGIRTYTDYRDLISDPEVDLVDICLPVELHRPVAIEALRAGKHVIVEKPIAPTVADADVMIQAAEEAGRRLLCRPRRPLLPLSLPMSRKCSTAASTASFLRPTSNE